MTSKKMGRPTDNPKETRITIRLDVESQMILEEYKEKHGGSNASIVRKAIKKLKD